MRLCHFNHCVDHRTSIGPFDRITEQPVLPAHSEWTDRILAEIVGKATASILQIDFCCITSVEDIIYCFIHLAIPNGFLPVKPQPESLQNRFFLPDTQLLPFFIIARIFFVNGVLYSKQTVTVLDSLYYQLAVIILFPFGNGITKVPTNVCPAGTAPDIWQAVAALVAIRFQITVIAFHELFCMAATFGWRIAI